MAYVNGKEGPGKEKKETKQRKKLKAQACLLASNAYLLFARNQRSGPKRITGNFFVLLLYFCSIIHYSCYSHTIRGIQSKHILHKVQMNRTFSRRKQGCRKHERIKAQALKLTTKPKTGKTKMKSHETRWQMRMERKVREKKERK